MDSLRQLASRLVGFFRRKNLEAEMAEEMRQHLQWRIQEKIAAGMAPDEARYAAQREFGGLEQIKEAARAERAFVWVEQSLQDVRIAARSLRKTAGFTAICVITFAVVIGAATAIVSLADAFFMRPS